MEILVIVEAVKELRCFGKEIILRTLVDEKVVLGKTIKKFKITKEHGVFFDAKISVKKKLTINDIYVCDQGLKWLVVGDQALEGSVLRNIDDTVLSFKAPSVISFFASAMQL